MLSQVPLRGVWRPSPKKTFQWNGGFRKLCFNNETDIFKCFIFWGNFNKGSFLDLPLFSYGVDYNHTNCATVHFVYRISPNKNAGALYKMSRGGRFYFVMNFLILPNLIHQELYRILLAPYFSHIHCSERQLRSTIYWWNETMVSAMKYSLVHSFRSKITFCDINYYSQTQPEFRKTVIHQ